MLRGGRLLVIPVVLLLLMASAWWAQQQRFPVSRPAAELVLQQADLDGGFVPVAAETGAILTNPYDDYTAHFRSGFRAVFEGSADSRWQGARLISSTFVVDQKGAASVFNAYAAQTQHRGQPLALAPLGEQSLFLVAQDEHAAPVVVIGAVRVKNVLITLTLLTDRDTDPEQVYRWAERLVGRLSVTD